MLAAAALLTACAQPVAEEPQGSNARPVAPEVGPESTAAETAADPPPGIVAVVARNTTPSNRRCGEIGTDPTAAPPGLTGPLGEIGRALVAPNGHARIGNVEVNYDPSVMFGTRRAFSREPGLVAEIDRDVEPIDGAWGGRVRVPDGKAPITLEVGPYRIEAHPRPGSHATLPDLDVRVMRLGCKRNGSAEWPGENASLWLGNAAMRLQTLSDGDSRLQLSSVERDAGASLSFLWSLSGPGPSFRETLEITPDVVGHEFSALGYEGTIAAVESAQGVHFAAGAWTHEDGEAIRVAVRIDLRQSPKGRSPATPSILGPGCGAPSPSPAARPVDAARAPVLKERARVSASTAAVSLGPYSLKLEHEPAVKPPGKRRQLPDRWRLEIKDASGSVRANEVLKAAETARIRVDDDLLVVQPAPGRAVSPMVVRRLHLACDAKLQGPLSAVSGHEVWMSTAGLELVEFTRPPPGSSLFLQLRVYGDTVNLSVGDDPASYSTAVSPKTAGDAFVLLGRKVEVLEVVPVAGTTWAVDHWETTAPEGPHVLVRIGLS